MKRSKKQLQDGESRSEVPLWKRVAPALAAPVSGFLLFLSFPPYNLHFLAWVALAPVIVAMRRASRRGAYAEGYLFVFAFLSLLLWWLALVRYPAIIAYVIFSLLLPVFFLPWAWAVNRFPARLPGVAAAAGASAVWVLLEWMFSHGQFAFPWFALGNSQIKDAYAVQAASLGGVYLVSFMVLMANFLVAALAEGRAKEQKVGWAAVGAGLVLLFGYGVATVPRAGAVPEGPGVKVAAIQADYPYELKEAGVTSETLYYDHRRMTMEAAASEDKPDIVVWSESVAYLSWLEGQEYENSMKPIIEATGITLVAGVYEYDDEGRYYNAVTVLEPGSGPIGKYRKLQTVPFGEVFPYRSTIEKISPAMGKWIAENVYAGDVTAGTEYTVFHSRHGKFAAMVCFDSVIPSIPRRLAAEGAQYMFVLSNDAWSPSRVGLVQHAMQGAMRAVENRRYLVQSTNSGHTDIIDPWGRETASAPMGEKTTLRGRVWPVDDVTLYTRFGDWFCWLCLAVAAGGIVTARIAGGRMKKENDVRDDA